MKSMPPAGDEPVHWRSLAHLQGDSSHAEAARGEFPVGADLAPDGMSRRQMLSLVGATVSIAGLTSCRRPIEKIVPYVRPPEEVVPGIPRYYATTMPFGRTAYGLVVESHEGRPTKVEGNELHPATSGASSTWMQAAIYDLYDPDRSGSVRKQGAASTWDEFDAFWKEKSASIRADGGAGLAILSEPFSSPTTARLRARLLETFPKARWSTYEPLSNENELAGAELASGKAVEAVHHYEHASVVVAIDADPFGCDLESVRNARGFAEARRLGGEPGEGAATPAMSRLYVVESTFTATGGLADHRLRLRRGRMSAFVAALAGELGVAPAGEARDVDPEWVQAVAQDLAANRGKCLVVAGAQLAPAVHAMVLAINAKLGNLGKTISYHAPRDATRSKLSELAELVAAMRGGQIGTLLVLGGNPVYDAPADLGFSDALTKVATVVHLSEKVDETSAAAHWHLPRAHFLESWDDARSADGTLSIVQPLILPLHGGRSTVEMLAGLSADPTKKDAATGYDLVRETWRSILGESDFEPHWEQVLHDGVLPGSALANELTDARVPASGTGLAGDATAEPAAQSLELAFQPSFTVFDGRFANVGWLQELPDIATKLVWSNAALVSFATARELGLGNEDSAILSVGDAKIEIPVLIQPGQADHTITVSLGYGREVAGRVGTGVGVDAYRLRTTKALAWVAGARLEKTGKTHDLALTQDHWIIDDLGARERDRRVPTLIREASLAEFVHEPEFAKEMVEHPPLESLWKEKSYSEGPQWGMTFDLGVCTGCNACVTACQAENNIPVVGADQVRRGREMHWIRVDRYFKGNPDDPDAMLVQPITCMQCENAPCEQVCPVAATVHDDHGINTMVYNRCIGTRYCSNNCPYKVRRFNYYNFTKDTPETLKMAMNPDVTVRARGVMEKCTYCLQRINGARMRAKLDDRPLADGDIRTACQQACPVRAIEFGDIRDPESRVTKVKAQPRNYELLAELNVKPRTSYLARIRNPNPALEKA